MSVISEIGVYDFVKINWLYRSWGHDNEHRTSRAILD